MKKSLWAAFFTSSIGWGGQGVITIQDDQISGGDGEFYYHGGFSVNASNVATASIHIKSYGATPHSILPGVNEYTTTFTGQYNEQEMILTSSIVEPLRATISVKLKKITVL